MAMNRWFLIRVRDMRGARRRVGYGDIGRSLLMMLWTLKVRRFGLMCISCRMRVCARLIMIGVLIMLLLTLVIRYRLVLPRIGNRL